MEEESQKKNINQERTKNNFGKSPNEFLNNSQADGNIISPQPAPVKKIDSSREEKSQKKRAGSIPVIRTYRSDVTEYTQKAKKSYFDIVGAATKSKKAHEEIMGVPIGKMATIIGIGVLFCVSIGVATYFMFFGQKEEATEVLRAPKSVIREDNQHTITFLEKDREDLINQIHERMAIPQISGNFLYLPILEESADNQQKFLNSVEFFTASGIPVSQNISGSLALPFTLGIIDTYGQNELVIISKINDYSRVFAGMLEWEKSIVNDFRFILPKTKSTDIGMAVFKDVVVKNQDARIINNVEGVPILAYTIFNRGYLVITSSRASLEIVLEKLLISPPII